MRETPAPEFASGAKNQSNGIHECKPRDIDEVPLHIRKQIAQSRSPTTPNSDAVDLVQNVQPVVVLTVGGLPTPYRVCVRPNLLNPVSHYIHNVYAFYVERFFEADE